MSELIYFLILSAYIYCSATIIHGHIDDKFSKLREDLNLPKEKEDE